VSSVSHAQEKVREELQQEESELRDNELLQLDVVKALLRIDTHIRLLYTLEHLHPPTETVLNIISIMCRIASHSSIAAWTLADTKGLLDCLIKRHLPTDIHKLLTGENVSQMTSVEGVPLRHLLSLLRILCSWDKTLAHMIVRNYKIFDRILPYVSQDPTEVALPLSEALSLSVESYSLWCVLLSYGLPEAQEALISFWPLLIRQLHFYRDKVNINEDTGSNELNFDLGANLVQLLAYGLSVASSKDKLERELRINREVKVALGNRSELLQNPSLKWDDMIPIIDLVITCGSKWFTQLKKSRTTYSGLKLLGSLCNYFKTYLMKFKDVESADSEAVEKSVGKFYSTYLSNFFVDDCMTHLLDSLIPHSPLCSKFVPSDCDDAKNLSSISTIVFDNEANVHNYPMFRKHSPYPLLVPLTSLLLTIHQEFPNISSISSLSVINHPSLLKYLQSICKSDLSLKSHWFTRIESKFLMQLGSLAHECSTKHTVLYHQIAMVAVSTLQKGQEYLARQLLTKVVSSDHLLSDAGDVSAQVQSVGLSQYEPLASPALMDTPLTPNLMVSKILRELSPAAQQFASNLLDAKPTKRSVIWCKDLFFMKNTLSLEHIDDWKLFDEYWLLLPLKRIMLERIIKMSLANEEVKKGNGVPSTLSERNQSTPEEIQEIGRCLQFTYLFVKFRRDFLFSFTNVTGWLRHLALIFLVADDLFLDHTINSYLQGCFRELLQNGGYNNFNDKIEISGLGNTFDWYKKLIEQYIAVSYGDSTFALMLLIPSQQSCPIAFRSLLWGDLSPVASFMDPAEEDSEMLVKYQSALATGVLTERRSPFMWSLAVHHLKAAHAKGLLRPAN